MDLMEPMGGDSRGSSVKNKPLTTGFPREANRSVRLHGNAPTRNRGGSEKQQVLIAVMGITGVGKTSFISKATGKDLQLGDSLEPATSRIQPHSFHHEFEHNNQRHNFDITLVDTPGFDDGRKPDIVLLEDFIRILGHYSIRGLPLSGIVYLHRINDNKMQGSAQQSLNLLSELCGHDFLKHVVLTTTMWDSIDEKVGVGREKDLKRTFWKNLMKRGAMWGRYYDNKGTAIEIIEKILREPLSRDEMPDIQRESLIEQKEPAETNAGRIIVEDLRRKVEQDEHRLSQTKNELQELEQGDYDEDTEAEIEQLRVEINELSEKRENDYSLLKRYDVDNVPRRSSNMDDTIDAANHPYNGPEEAQPIGVSYNQQNLFQSQDRNPDFSSPSRDEVKRRDRAPRPKQLRKLPSSSTVPQSRPFGMTQDVDSLNDPIQSQNADSPPSERSPSQDEMKRRDRAPRPKQHRKLPSSSTVPQSQPFGMTQDVDSLNDPIQSQNADSPPSERSPSPWQPNEKPPRYD